MVSQLPPAAAPMPVMDPVVDPMQVQIEMPPEVGPTEWEWTIVGGKPPKPKEDAVLDEAKHEEDAHQGRISLALEFDGWLEHRRFGYFPRDAEDILSNEVSKYFDHSLRMEDDALVGFIASMKIGITASYRNMFDRDDAAAKEDLVHFALKRFESDHTKSGNGMLRYDVPRSLSRTSMCVISMLVDPENIDTGVRSRMVDPLTTFPVYESGRGLARLYRSYQTTAATLVGDFDTSERRVERELKKIIGYRNSRTGRDYDLTEMVDVVEYWDRRWCQLYVEDKLVYEWDHGYAHVPFIIQNGGFGRPMFMSSTPVPYEVEGVGLVHRPYGPAVREDDLTRMYEPFLWNRVLPHAQSEEIGSQLKTLLRRAKNPPRVHKQTAGGGMLQGVVKVDNREGGMTRIRDNEDIANLDPALPGDMMAHLVGMLDINRQMSGMPALMMGNMPGSQASGTAIDILTQSGARAWIPMVNATEALYAQWAERQLLLTGNYGPLMNQGEGQIMVPRRNANVETGEQRPHRVTADIIRRTGTQIEVKLYQFNPTTLGQVASGLQIMDDRGWVSRRSAIEMFAFTEDIEGEISAIMHDDLDKVPEVMMADTLDELKKQAALAHSQGDMEGAKKLLNRAHFIAGQIDFNQMVRMPGAMNSLGDPMIAAQSMGIDPSLVIPQEGAAAGGAAEGEEVPGTPVSPEMQVGQDGAPGVQGNSMPQYNRPTGTEGGRPPGVKAVG